MSANGLGIRRDATRTPPSHAVRVTIPSTPALSSSFFSPPFVLLLSTLYFGLFVPPAPAFLYESGADYTDAGPRAMTLVFAVVGAGMVVLAPIQALQQALLGFHVGVEAYVVERALRYAGDAGHKDHDRALAAVGAAVVIAHLIPFFLVDRRTLLMVLAFAGVVVNVLLALLALPERGATLLLLLGTSSGALLAVSRFGWVSLLTLARRAFA